MQNFQLIDNTFINAVDSLSIKEPVTEKPLTNSLKTLVKTFDYQQISNNGIFGRQQTIKIDRSYNYLSQIFLKFTVSTGGVTAIADPYFATKLLKYIRIVTTQGTVLQTITPEYSQSRIDQLYGNPNYSWCALGIEPDTDFSTDATCVLPLFLFCSEGPNSFLETRKLEQLELELTTNDTSDLMGISETITSIQVEVFSTYHNTSDTNKLDDFTYTVKPGMSKQLYRSYDMYSEEKMAVLTGATSVKVLLKCPHPLFTLNMKLVDANANNAQIKTVKLKVGNDEFLNMDYRMNFQMYGEQSGFLENGTFTYFFGKTKKRDVPSGLITFSKDFYPCWATIEFDALATDCVLHTFEEYYTNFMIADTGTIKLSTDVIMKLPTEGQDFVNSVTAGQTFHSL